VSPAGGGRSAYRGIVSHALATDLLRTKFAAGVPYDAYVAAGKPHEQHNWQGFHSRVHPTDAERALLAGFARRINVLCISGIWCGDCVQQCPFLAHIERANPSCIALRFVDRDEHADLADGLKICGGKRVPVVLFLNEDFEFVSLLGDRTLSRYRALAARNLGGAACPLPGAPTPPDEIAAELQDFVDEFERVHLLLRLSPKLRQRHGD